MPRKSNSLIGIKRRAQREGWIRWIRSEADERAVLNGCWFDLGRAEHAVNFFPTFLHHSKGDFAGQPFELLSWQRDEIIMPLFGYVRHDPLGHVIRRYSKAYVEIPKKNGKSTLAAGLGLYMLCGDGEAGAEVYSAATSREQARIVHREAVAMVQASEALSQVLQVNRSTWQISDHTTGSFYRALTSKPRTNEGWNAHCIIADELHEWDGRELYDALRWAFAARSQPLFFQITTAGDDPQSVCREQHDYAEGVAGGTIHDDSFLPCIHAAAPGDDIEDPAVWAKANPSLGVTLPEDRFRQDYHEARVSLPSLTRWKRYRLNIWATTKVVWLRPEDWQACQRPFTEADLRGRQCIAALDLARSRDTSALVLLFPDEDPDSEDTFLLPFFWLPEAVARERNHLVSYLEWGQAGFLEITPGEVTDYSYIRRQLERLTELFTITQLVYDPKYAAELTLWAEETLGIPRVSFAQNWPNFAGPTDEFERRVISGRMHHSGHPVLTWQVLHSVVKQSSAGDKRVFKPGDDHDYRTVDGTIASIMALAQDMALRQETGSAYDLPEEERVVFL